jgi:hypothetical protein
MTTFNWQPLASDGLRWLLVDFDLTIAGNSGHPDYLPSEPLEGAVESLKKLDKEGYKITIFTARAWSDYHNIENYCKHYGIPTRRIICGKPLAVCLIDDKAIGFLNWKQSLEDLERFK